MALAALLAPSPCNSAPKPKRPAEVERKLDYPSAVGLGIGYVSRSRPRGIVPYFESVIADLGLQGARLGVEDNNTTGRFVGQRFSLKAEVLEVGGDAVAAVEKLVESGIRLILVDLPGDEIQQLAASPATQKGLIFDISSIDDGLRGSSCSTRVMHLLPDRAMRADALAQYLAKKRWNRWLLVVGREPGDRLYAEAVERAAKRFGGEIVARKDWVYSYDDRRSPESEVPVLTQGPDYDVVWVLDESAEFGDLLAYRSWLPRPVVGTQGLVAVAWHRTHEAWGALQLQSRFREYAGRWMHEVDYAAWLAVRAIGEAAVRSKSLDFDTLQAFLRGDQLTLAGFKGVPLSFRRWDGQLRQPVLLAHERSLVAVAPIDGFIHPTNELDTLGHDRSESACRAETSR